MSFQDCDLLFKVLVVGNANVGKSALLHRFVHGADSSYNWHDYRSTIGVDFKSCTMDIAGERVKFQVWDTAGQERFRSITSSYYRGAQGVMVVYSVTDRRSFNNVDYWLNEIQTYAGSRVCKLLVGNKGDLAGNRRVTHAEGDEKAAQNAYFPLEFFETSAMLNYNVREAFLALGMAIKDSGPGLEKICDHGSASVLHVPVAAPEGRGCTSC